MNNKRNDIARLLWAESLNRQAPDLRGVKVRKNSPRAEAKRASRLDQRRGLIVFASLIALLAGVLAGGYGVHSQMSAASERATRQNWQIAETTRGELRQGAVLFVPIGGNVCRRRFIDNATWTVRDGGEVECDREASWNSTVPELQPYNVGMRMDAVRNTFRGKSSSNLE
jgi:hypothetical protein